MAVGVTPCAASEHQLPPEFAEIIEILTVLAAYNDRRWVTEELATVLRDRVKEITRRRRDAQADSRGA